MSTITWHSTLNISETVRNRGLVLKEHQSEMAHGLSNGYVKVTSRDLDRSNSWPQYAWSAISWKRLDSDTPFQRTTNRKWHIDYQMVTSLMTSHDPRRCCEAVRSAILATAWLLVLASKWLVEKARHFTGYHFFCKFKFCKSDAGLILFTDQER